MLIITEELLETEIFLLETLKEYGEVAGLKINHQRTKILTKDMQEKEANELMILMNFKEDKKLNI